jgi:hypothetical protein
MLIGLGSGIKKILKLRPSCLFIELLTNNDSMFASHHQSPFIWLADSSKAPSAVHNPRTPLNNGMVQAPCKGKMAADDRATLRHFFRAVKHHFNE